MSETLCLLLVEDQEADAILIQRELRRQGLTFTVRRVDHDEAMIRALREFAPDLVISDLSLPGFSGLEALAILRKERPGVPLIFVSGTIDDEQAVEMLKLGATDYVLKENLSRLPASINRALREARLERERSWGEALRREVIEKTAAQAPRAGRTEGAVQQMPVSVVHDLNNILAPISMAVSMLRGKLPDAERGRMCDIIENSARQASEIVRAAATFGRVAESARHPLEIGRGIKEVFQKLQKTWPETLRVKLAVEDNLWRVTGNAAQIKQVIFELCVRAGDAMPGGGTLRLSLGNRQIEASDPHRPPGIKPGPFVVLEVSDTRDRPPSEIAARMIAPGVAVQAADNGSASGLVAWHHIVKQHGGFVHTVIVPGEGTTCKVAWPATREEPRATTPAAAAAPRRDTGECILLVDDEETIRFAARSVLSKHGYRVLTATDGAEALKVFDAQGDQIALVLTDLMMPVMDGMALVRALRRIRPETPVIVSSGQNEKTRLAELQAAGINSVLNKPYAADILLRTVSEVLGQRATAAAG